MTRSELIKKMYISFPDLRLEDADIAVRILIDELIQALYRGDRIEIRGFGSFRINHRKGRVARNPRNGDKVFVQEKYVPRYRASSQLVKRINAIS